MQDIEKKKENKEIAEANIEISRKVDELILADEIYLKFVSIKDFEKYDSINTIWEKIGDKGIDGNYNAILEYQILQFYMNFVKDEIKEHLVEDFEKKLLELRKYINNEKEYKANFAEFIYAFLLVQFNENFNTEKFDIYWKDIEFLAQKGIIAAQYYLGIKNNDIKALIDAAKFNFPDAALQLKNFYSMRFTEKNDLWDKALAERWENIVLISK